MDAANDQNSPFVYKPSPAAAELNVASDKPTTAELQHSESTGLDSLPPF